MDTFVDDHSSTQKRTSENHSIDMKPKQLKRSRPRFVDETIIENTGYICAICSKSLWRPHQTECCKRVCEDCLIDKFNDSLVLYECPIEEHSDDDQHTLDEYKIEDFLVDSACDRFLHEQKVYCDNYIRGCQQPVQLKNLEAHLPECPYRMVQCANTPCKTTYYQIDQQQHENVCPYLEIRCPDCKETVRRNGYQTHLNLLCSHSSQLTCDVCKKTYSKRSRLVNHQSTSPGCIKRGGRCFFSYLGCSFNCEASEEELLNEHMKSSIDFHMEMLALSLGQNNLESVESIHNDTMNKLRPIQLAVAGMEQQTLLDCIKIVEGGVTSERVDCMKEEFDITSARLEDFRQGEQTHSLRTERRLHIIENRLVQVRRELSSTVEQILPGVDLESLTLMMNPTPSSDGVIYVAEPGQPTNGEFVWVIDNFAIKRRSAESNVETFIYSEPFYTSPHGYKLMLKFYPFGDGTCRGKFVSLYIVIMKGPYDNSLEWPFQRKVTMAVFEPDCNSLADRSRIFSSDDGVAYKRPVSEMNPPSGCSNFIDIKNINNYLHNDNLTVLITVEPKSTWSEKVLEYR